jgi:hypothetical protein
MTVVGLGDGTVEDGVGAGVGDGVGLRTHALIIPFSSRRLPFTAHLNDARRVHLAVSRILLCYGPKLRRPTAPLTTSATR